MFNRFRAGLAGARVTGRLAFVQQAVEQLVAFFVTLNIIEIRGEITIKNEQNSSYLIDVSVGYGAADDLARVPLAAALLGDVRGTGGTGARVALLGARVCAVRRAQLAAYLQQLPLRTSATTLFCSTNIAAGVRGVHARGPRALLLAAEADVLLGQALVDVLAAGAAPVDEHCMQ